MILASSQSKTTQGESDQDLKTFSKNKKFRVALVCDWLTVVGGAEQVLREIHQIFPTAPIYTSQYRPKGIDWFKDAEVKTGYLNFFPAFTRRFIAPLRQAYFKHLDLTGYDLVISVSGCDAKYVKTKPGVHFCYCHVPTQYYWGKSIEYQKDPGFGPLNFLVRPIFKLLLPRLRKKDLEAAARPDYYITISEFAKSEIKKFYKREAKVIYPPVNTEKFSEVVKYKDIKQGNCQILEQHQNQKNQMNQKTYDTIENNKSQIEQKNYHTIKSTYSQAQPESGHNIKSSSRQCVTVENYVKSIISPAQNGYFINFSRQVSWKRLDLAILACIKEKQPLVLIGDGPEHQNLARLAATHPDLITLLSTMPQSELKEYLKNAKAFIFPSEEPFGIAPVEALAAGCPVIAFSKGGAKDYILDKKNGVFFDHQSVNSLVAAIKKFNYLYYETENLEDGNNKKTVSQEHISHSSLLSPLEISKTAEKFSTHHFKEQLEEYLARTISSTKVQFQQKHTNQER
ncbi:MAG: glycosyltransferase [Candidatus Nanosyncoccus sp.]